MFNGLLNTDWEKHGTIVSDEIDDNMKEGSSNMPKGYANILFYVLLFQVQNIQPPYFTKLQIIHNIDNLL